MKEKKKYIFCFGYLTPELVDNYNKYGWDDEFSRGVFLYADDESSAINVGKKIANEYVKETLNN